MTAPPVQPDVSAHAVAEQLSGLLPPMHFLLRPGRHGAHGRRDEPPTAVGYPSSYLEWHTNLVGSYMAHLISLLTEAAADD